MISREAYYEALLHLYGVTSAEDVARGKEVMLAEEDALHYFAGVPETLAALKAAGFLLGVITDTAAPLHAKLEWFERGGFGGCWDSVVSSRMVGVRKPHPAIYQSALEQLGIQAGEALFVGHKGVELDGARSAGMKTAAFNYEREARADFYIEDFPDLLSLPPVGLGAGKE